MAKRVTQLILAIGMATIALLMSLVLLSGLAPVTEAATYCVSAVGTGGCDTTIQDAVNGAIAGDTINVETGTYTENVVITKNLTLWGGCNVGCTSRTSRSSIINGDGAGVVISITNSAVVTIDGFTITGGDGSNNVYLNDGNLDSGGGGIFIREATAIIRDNLIEDNVGSQITTTSGLGGGILVISSTNPVRIYSNTIRANVAQSVTLAASAPISVGVGGGIVIGDDSSAIITGNQVLSNVALRANIPPANTWSGGSGIAWWGDDITIDGNTIQGNTGNEAGGDGSGGGIGLWGAVATVTNNSIIQNTAAITGTYADGGGISLSGRRFQKLTLTGNWVMSNTAIVTASSTATPQDTWVGGGGIRINGSRALNDSLTVENNHIIGNVAARTMTTAGANSSGHVDGGGLSVANITSTLIISNEVRGNTAVENLSLSGNGSGDWGGRPAGGGMYLGDIDTLTVSDNKVRDNVTAQQQVVKDVDSNSEAGGIALINVENATVSTNTVSGNTAVVTGSITSNTGENYYPSGGGIRIGCWDIPSCTLSFAGNDISNNTTAYTITVGGSDAEGRANGGGFVADQVTNLYFNGDIIRGNQALVFGSASGNNRVDAEGGGVRFGETNMVTIGGSGCTIESNVAAETAQEARGGGIRSWNSIITLSDCTIKDNQALVNGDRGEGGGLSMDNNSSISNPTVTLTGNRIEGNVAFGSGSGEGSGGGVRIRGVVSATLTSNTIVSNVAAMSATVSGGGNWGGGNGGGVYIESNDSYTPTVVISNNVIAYNTAAITVTVSGGGDGGVDGGGVRLSQVAAATIISNQVSSNVGLQSGTATGSGSQLYANGGGLSFNQIPTATLQMNRIEDNVGANSITLSGGATNGGGGGGGINLYQSTALLQRNVISGNTGNLDGDGWGGGVNPNQSTVTMERNFILGNRMNPTYNGGSGGVWVWQSTLTSTNDVFARNYDAIGGGDGGGNASTITLINDTLYNNSRTGGSVNDSSTMYVTNTIVYSHNDGLRADNSATIIEDYNLLSNTNNYAGAGGVTTGTNTITNTDPLFNNAAADDFHLTSGSPAIDKGTSTGAPSVDFDGNPRGAKIDIGAYELSKQNIYLPIIMKNSS